MEEIILVFYIYLGNLGADEAQEYMERCRAELSHNKPAHHKYFFIPTREQDSKVECIFPRIFGTRDDAGRVLETLTSIEEMLTEQIQRIHHEIRIDYPKQFVIK